MEGSGATRWAVAAAVAAQWRSQLRKWREMRKVAGRLAPFVRRRRARLGLALACGVGYTLARLAEPWTLKLIFDNVLLGHPVPPWLAAHLEAVAGDRLWLLNGLVAAIIVLAIARGFLYFWQHLVVASVGQQVVADVRLEL